MTTKSERRVQVVMSWGGTPQGMLFVKPGMRVWIGDVPGVSFLLPSEHVPAPFSLLESDESGFVVRAPEGATVRAARAGAELTEIALDALGARAITIDPDTKVEIELGPFVFFIAETDGDDAKLPLARPDVRSWRWVGVSLAFHVAFLSSLFFMPPNAGALSLDLTGTDRDYVRIHLDAIERERIELPPIEVGDGAVSTAGQPTEGEEGTAGAVEETRHTGGGVRVRGESADRRVPLTTTSVTTAGALGVIATFSQSFQSVSSPFGAEAAMGWAPDAAYGALMADASGFGAGTGGLGMQGTGRGGGCLPGQPCGAGTIGVGGLGTGGFGGATCTDEEFLAIERSRGHAAAVDSCSVGGLGHGGGTGFGTPRDREHVARVPPPTCARDASGQCAQVTNGGLSREQVRMVITRNRGQIRHCYEQALVARPDLEGRLSVRWMIHPEGRVLGAQISGANEIQSPQVEQCMVQAVSRWQFPASNSPTAVTYPFVFQSHE